MIDLFWLSKDFGNKFLPVLFSLL